MPVFVDSFLLYTTMLEQEQINKNGLFPDNEIHTVHFYFMFKEMDISISKKAVLFSVALLGVVDLHLELFQLISKLKWLTIDLIMFDRVIYHCEVSRVDQPLTLMKKIHK